MENIINKKALIGIVLIVVLGWFAMSMVNKPSDMGTNAPITETATTTSATTTVKAIPTTVKKTTPPPASKPVSLSYQNALELYQDNKRIQISGADFCQVSPNNVMYKNGTSIMLDNRSAITRTIKIGVGETYTIEGYGFRIVKLSSATLPATLLMDCGTQQNIAKILLQR